jgi:hypothetical protein
MNLLSKNNISKLSKLESPHFYHHDYRVSCKLKQQSIQQSSTRYAHYESSSNTLLFNLFINIFYLLALIPIFMAGMV